MKHTTLCLFTLLLVPLAGYGSPQADRSDAVRKLLVDPEATAGTVALFYNLKQSAKRRILIGQQNPDVTFLGTAGESDIKKVTGNDPAVWGSQVRESSVVRKDGRNLFVDVVGFDDYADFERNEVAAAAAKILIVSTYAKNHGKLAALTELGYRKHPVPQDLYTARFGAALADPSTGSTANPLREEE